MLISESGGDAALVRHPRSYFRQGCLKGGTPVGLSVFLDQRGPAYPASAPPGARSPVVALPGFFTGVGWAGTPVTGSGIRGWGIPEVRY